MKPDFKLKTNSSCVPRICTVFTALERHTDLVLAKTFFLKKCPCELGAYYEHLERVFESIVIPIWEHFKTIHVRLLVKYAFSSRD